MATSEMMMDHAKDQLTEDAMRNIYNSATKLSLRVDELLDLARGEVGTLRLKPESIDFKQILEELASLSRYSSQRNGTIFKYEVPNDLPVVFADGERLRQVVQNMLSNAHKFTPEGGEVVLRAYEDTGRLYVEVENEGSRIKKEDRERIFVPYYQREGDRERFSGLGIGLALSRQFVRLHSGDMWIEDRGRNVFIFYIPIKPKGGKQDESIDN